MTFLSVVFFQTFYFYSLYWYTNICTFYSFTSPFELCCCVVLNIKVDLILEGEYFWVARLWGHSWVFSIEKNKNALYEKICLKKCHVMLSYIILLLKVSTSNHGSLVRAVTDYILVVKQLKNEEKNIVLRVAKADTGYFCILQNYFDKCIILIMANKSLFTSVHFRVSLFLTFNSYVSQYFTNLFFVQIFILLFNTSDININLFQAKS